MSAGIAIPNERRPSARIERRYSETGGRGRRGAPAVSSGPMVALYARPAWSPSGSWDTMHARPARSNMKTEPLTIPFGEPTAPGESGAAPSSEPAIVDSGALALDAEQ